MDDFSELGKRITGVILVALFLVVSIALLLADAADGSFELPIVAQVMDAIKNIRIDFPSTGGI